MKSALVLIDIQKGFLDPSWGKRNNPNFESNVAKLLSHWRSKKQSILHVQHLSSEMNSPLRPDVPGVEFMDFAKPIAGEPVFRKNVHSGFIGTDLEISLKNLKIEHLILVGLTSDHC